MDNMNALKLVPSNVKSKPLLGTTILIIEDSKYVCEAMRLMCLHSGARLRHADTVAAARRHLRLYRPNIVIIDEGLPDGSGSEFAAELNGMSPRVDVIFGTSGESMCHHQFLKAGANGFIEKPFVSLSEFQLKMLSALPESHFFPVSVSDTHEIVEPNPAIYAEDLRKAHDLLLNMPDIQTKKYVSQFLKSVCTITDDQEMLTALERDEEPQLLARLKSRVVPKRAV